MTKEHLENALNYANEHAKVTDSIIEANQLLYHGVLFGWDAAMKERDWISVENDLPKLIEGKDYSENVFVWCNDKLMVMSLSFMPDDDGKWHYFWANCYGDIDGDGEVDDDYRPTHWMPLPSPPAK